VSIEQAVDAVTDEEFWVRFWGVRGSVPVSGPEFSHYGGNTACIEVNCGQHTLIFDAGSGFRPAGLSMIERGIKDFDIFFTHCHYDHIIGLPFFAPLYKPDFQVTVWSGHLAGIMTTREMMKAFMKTPWFPVPLDICRANISCQDFRGGDILKPRKGIKIRTGHLNHPGNCIGYRIEWGGRVVALVSDTEHVEGVLDANVLALIKDADLVIYDANYVDAEMETYRGWGHSTWQQGVRLCKAAGARQLALFHHDKGRTDAQLTEIEREARRSFSTAFAARDGQVVEF
jgi:phosphoribosyl 1,2-cyclic phosphodiesterase